MSNGTKCTYCNELATSRDHVIPKALWIVNSEERPIKVPSCRECNNHSDEGLLKSFFAIFDDQVAMERAPELTRPEGKGDLRRFLQCCSDDLKLAYPTADLTVLFQKLFLGLRRHFMGPKWYFAPRSSMSVLTLEKVQAEYVVRALPYQVGCANKGYFLQQNFHDHLSTANFDFHFKGFHGTMMDCGTLLLRYDRRTKHNEFILAGITYSQ
jgi:hypothetical protein